MTDEYLLERGYKQYNPIPRIDHEHIIARFQKRFDDNFGKKYFIDVLKWSNEYIPQAYRDEWYTSFTYEYSVQITMGENENPVNLQFFSSWELEQVEHFMENFFKKMKPNYYEDWDGRRAVRPINSKSGDNR